MATRRNPFCSKRLMISPTRLRCTPSGLMAMKVRSMRAAVLRAGGPVSARLARRQKPRWSRNASRSPRGRPPAAPAPPRPEARRPSPRAAPRGHVASRAPPPVGSAQMPAEGTRQESRGSAGPADREGACRRGRAGAGARGGAGGGARRLTGKRAGGRRRSCAAGPEPRPGTTTGAGDTRGGGARGGHTPGRQAPNPRGRTQPGDSVHAPARGGNEWGLLGQEVAP